MGRKQLQVIWIEKLTKHHNPSRRNFGPKEVPVLIKVKEAMIVFEINVISHHPDNINKLSFEDKDPFKRAAML